MSRLVAIVPPEKPPRMSVTRSVTFAKAPPAAFESMRVPRSDGIESNPQACTIRAPDSRATASSSCAVRRMKSTSAVRSQ